ncbi:transglycosylase domain-containing protein [Cellulomonas sp. GbtcB1]|uniref:transglycosylase domain-containing protein n=1 Tax=Cellulomonas sp. GbtcB1 TaxID=2824746 RepID=UPI001C2FF75E|nr:transglycosylase domain-containing protein [Cellulomonas sp. GbtcB1]
MAGSNRRSATTAARGTAASGGRRRIIDYPRRGYRGLHRWLPSWRFVVGSVIGFVFLCLGLGVAAYALTDVPAPDDFAEEQASTVYFADGTTEIGSYDGPNRTLVDYESLPAHVGEAVVSSEDRTFFENSGVSLTGMARALLNNVRGGATQGGSTLTQQYVERYYVGETTTSYVGKAKEALLAIKIAQTETKEQILGRYLNTIYFGRGAYGIEAAAQAYFGKPAAELSVSEAALLSGIIPSPGNWDPAVSQDKAEQRWNGVLDGMVRDGYLTQADRDAQTFPPTVAYSRSDRLGGTNGYLLTYVQQELVATGTITEDMLERRGLKIVTTIEPQVQQDAVDSVIRLLDPSDNMYEHANGEVPSPNLKVGVVSVDPATGGIVSMYGGRDFLADQVNRATKGNQQAGSTFKPFTLIAALENGIPLTKSYPGYSPQEFGTWKVNNFGFEDFGTIDLVKATEQSVNTVYAQLNLEVGPEKTADVAQRAGVKSPVNSEPSNVLGTDAVTTLDMATAYATIAAQGVYHKPYMVAEATYPDGDVAYTGQTQPVQKFEADVMADTTYAMTQVVEKGSGRAYVNPLDRPIAGKTGTSNDNKSAWFVGFTPQLATAVSLSQVGDNGSDPVTITPWGEDASGRSLTINDRGITGATWPAAVWADYMGKVFQIEKYAAVVDFPERANVNRAAVPTSEPTTSAPVETQAPEPEQPTTVAVPSGLTGQLSGDAQAALQNAGLVPSVAEEFNAAAAGTVLGVSPGEGSQVAPGSTVTLRVSKGPQPAPQPTEQPTEQAGNNGQGGNNGQAGGNAVNPNPNG